VTMANNIMQKEPLTMLSVELFTPKDDIVSGSLLL